MSAHARLEQLLNRRPDLWRGRARRSLPAAATGLDWLDRGLPGGGWPLGRLTELLPRVSGCGELRLLLPLLARCTQQGRPVVLAGPMLVPGPQALASAGVVLEHLVVVREVSEALWAAEQCLKSGLCGSIAIWPPAGRVGERAVRRLQLAAEQSPGPTFIVYRPDQSPPPSVAALRLGLSPGPRVEVMRSPAGLMESRWLEPAAEWNRSSIWAGIAVMFTRSSELWLGLHCPQLPLLAAWQCDLELPELHAVHGYHRGRHVILQASRVARRAGVTPGQPLSTALAVAPALHSRLRHLPAERSLLEQLALGAWQGSSHVVQAPPDSVLLEVAGSRRLYGGLRPLLDALCTHFERQGLPVRAGSAPVPATARLFACHGLHAGSLAVMREKLHALSLTALALDNDQARALAGCGLESVAGLLRLPRPERARRFGPELNRRLLCLEGRLPTPLAAWQPPQRFGLRLELPSASSDSSALLFVLRRAIARMEHWLTVRDQALTRLHVALMREDGGGSIPLDVGLSRPGTDEDRLLELLALKLENLQLPGAVEAVELSAESTDEHRPPQSDLWSGNNRGDAWPALLDRLRARLGEDGLAGLAPQPDHRPEKAWRWVAPGTSVCCEDERTRPTWLLPVPRPCRRENLRLEEGPERIEAGWWDEEDCRRDYFVARDRHGRRLWVFHEHQPREGWFIHGVFD